MDSSNTPIAALILSATTLIYSIIVMRYRVKHEELGLVTRRLDVVEAEHRECEEQQKALRLRIEGLSIDNINLMRQLVSNHNDHRSRLWLERKSNVKGVSVK